MITFLMQPRNKLDIDDTESGLDIWRRKFKVAKCSEGEKRSMESEALAKHYDRSERSLRQVTSLFGLVAYNDHYR